MEITAKIGKNNLMYVRDELLKVIGTEPKAIVNCKTILYYHSEASYDDILESLEIIKKDIELRNKGE